MIFVSWSFVLAVVLSLLILLLVVDFGDGFIKLCVLLLHLLLLHSVIGVLHLNAIHRSLSLMSHHARLLRLEVPAAHG